MVGKKLKRNMWKYKDKKMGRENKKECVKKKEEKRKLR